MVGQHSDWTNFWIHLFLHLFLLCFALLLHSFLRETGSGNAQNGRCFEESRLSPFRRFGSGMLQPITCEAKEWSHCDLDPSSDLIIKRDCLSNECSKYCVDGKDKIQRYHLPRAQRRSVICGDAKASERLITGEVGRSTTPSSEGHFVTKNMTRRVAR